MSENKTATLDVSPFKPAPATGAASDPQLHADITDAIALMAKQADLEEENSRSARGTRDTESREAETLELEAWTPSGLLPDPPQRDGWVHHWVRASTRNELDATNMAKAMREGWRPCDPAEYPEIMSTLFYKGDNPSVIEFGGLVLCRLSVGRDKARQEYHNKLNLAQTQSVNEKLGQVDPRLRFNHENRSTVKRSPY